MNKKVNKHGWWEGKLGIYKGDRVYEKGSIVVLVRDDYTDSPWWGLVSGKRLRNIRSDRTNAIFYSNVSGLGEYFRDISSPTQQEIDMFNMLHGTELTREDLCQGQ